MDILFTLLLFFVASITSTKATFEDEMAVLELDIGRDAAREQDTTEQMKKSIKDMTTEELIAELEKDLKSDEKHDDVKTISLKDKYQKRFESILTKKSLDEEMEMIRHDVMDKRENPYDGMVNAMYDDFVVQQEEKRIPGTCFDIRSDCADLKGYCESHRDKLQLSCNKTCGYCGDCKQRAGHARCEYLKGKNYCNSANVITWNRMSKLCPITCGFCKVPAPPKCSDTQFGCCWDKMTTKVDKAGKYCPVCRDEYKYVCKTFEIDCKSLKIAGTFMRRRCPETCRLCEGCADFGVEETRCIFWQKLNWCVDEKEVMAFYCPVTCNFCSVKERHSYGGHGAVGLVFNPMGRVTHMEKKGQ